MRYTAMLVVLLLSACAGMGDSMNQAAGIGAISQSVSDFDGAKNVEMSPAFLSDDNQHRQTPPVRLGARWSSATPDKVALVILHDGMGPVFAGFTSIAVNIGGNTQTFPTAGLTSLTASRYNRVSRSVATESENAAVIPLATLRTMMAAPDVRIRIASTSGDIDALFHPERRSFGDLTAKGRLRDFLAVIDAKTPN